MLPITKETIKRIRNNEFEEIVPELYELRPVIENGGGHINDSVFDHTLRVLERLFEIVDEASSSIALYLNQKAGKYERKQLLYLATLFHDLGKKEAMVEKDGVTSCIGHAEISYEKTKNILKRLDLSSQEDDIVLRIVRYHSGMHKASLSDNKEEKERFRAEFSDIYLELLLFGMADVLGSQTEEADKKDFDKRMEFYREEIKNY